MNDFVIENDIKRYIAEQLKIDMEYVDKCYNIYSNIIRKGIRENYLAHYVRVLENLIRKETGNDLFCILYDPYTDKNLNVGVGLYYEDVFYTICYPKNLDEMQIRDCLSHELGHLFLATILKKSYPEITDKSLEEINTEPISSLFGIMCMLDDSNFYDERCKKYIRRDPKKIIDDFLFITKRNKSHK